MMVAGALLRGALIVLHNRKGEDIRQSNDFPDIVPVELTAELPAQRIYEAQIQPGGSHPGEISHIIKGKRWNPADQNPASCRVNIKIQMDVFLELKPLLVYRSGISLKHPSCKKDPPSFCS